MTRGVSHGVSTGDRNRVDASVTTALAFRSQSNVMLVNKFPVGRRVAGAWADDGLVAGDVADNASYAAAVVGGCVVNCHVHHLVIRR